MKQEYDVFDKELPWTHREELINKLFPSTALLDWKKVFRQDPLVAGRVINDLIRVSAAEPGRPGKRPNANQEVTAAHFRGIQNDDYSILPFAEAFELIKGDRSVRAMANKTGIDKSLIQRLLKGQTDPTVSQMEAIAKALRKHPSYFIEYRIAYILGVIAERMRSVPEASVVPYLRLKSLS